MKRLTVIAVVEISDAAASLADDTLLGVFTERLEGTMPHVLVKLTSTPDRTGVDVAFASVYRGVSKAALEAGAEAPPPEEDTPFCKLCGKGQAFHLEHRPRHNFTTEGTLPITLATRNRYTPDAPGDLLPVDKPAAIRARADKLLDMARDKALQTYTLTEAVEIVFELEDTLDTEAATLLETERKGCYFRGASGFVITINRTPTAKVEE